MNPFDQAWDLLKEYTLDWRSDAQDYLLDLDRSLSSNELIGGFPLLPEPLVDDWENEEHPLYLGAGSKVVTYEHPFDSRYVIKVPYSDDRWSQEYSLDRNKNDATMALLERLGYPIVGELSNWDRIDDVSDSFFVQPRLDTGRRFTHPVDMKPDVKRLADASLMHLINDRNMNNYGSDTRGMLRNFDLDSIGFTDDWWPQEAHTRNDLFAHDNRKHWLHRHGFMSRGEQLQEHLNSFGIQHPASRLLNIIPEVSHEDIDDPFYRLQSFRNLMEEIEPHSDNPKNLTVDGKPIWLEGLV